MGADGRHDGGMPSAINTSLTSPDGSHQAVVMANRDANTWTEQIGTDDTAALLTAFCGQAPSQATAAPLARALRSLQATR